MSVIEQTFEQLVLSDPERQWELHRGRPREKPNMSRAHNMVLERLVRQLVPQLPRDSFSLRFNMGHVRRAAETYYIPDVYVVPVASNRPLPRPPDYLEVFDDPVSLVAEIWSPSTGSYDVASKLPEYQLRGDLEIWRLHPYERTLIAWQRQPDGSYPETVSHGGVVSLFALPGVTVDLDDLFA